VLHVPPADFHLRTALAGERTEIELDAVDRRGKAMAWAVTVTPLRAPRGEVRGAILMEAR
jgi:PAS fold